MLNKIVTHSSHFKSIFKASISKFDTALHTVLQTAPENKPTQVISTPERQQYRKQNKIKNKRCQSSCQEMENNWIRSHHNRLYTQKEAIAQATRCMKCADSPCQKACSTGIDIRSFIYQIQNQNYYGAAKTILSDNPLGLSCGGLCPVSELCASTCNAHWIQGGTIQIGKLQQFACKVFKDMKVKQIRDPSLPDLPKALSQQKIVLIGSGSASLSCASYLGRLGYKNIHIYQKKPYNGGLVSSEIPSNRSNLQDIEWQIQMVKELGVNFHYDKEVNQKNIDKDAGAIFYGVGLNSPKHPLGKQIYFMPNVFNSKNFLPNVCEHSKYGKTLTKQFPFDKNTNSLFKLNGHVVVLGIGDTALDCARSALRVGAQRVTIVFRKGFQDVRANDELFDPALYQKINFMPNLEPVGVTSQNNLATAIEFNQYMKNSKGEYVNTNQKIKVNCNYLITAFGSYDDGGTSKILYDQQGNILINKNTMQHLKHQNVFAGGDILQHNNLVDAVNDGKVASWAIHKFLSKKHNIKVSAQPKLPGFFTQIDLVDLSIQMSGVKFQNPFGLASAPPATSYPMIRRAFQMGWGFCVTKTFVLDKDQIQNVSPRIFKATNNPLRNEASFSNIELISQKRAKYWVQGAKQLKKDFPNKIIIGSIMASYNQADWKQLAAMCKQANFDIVQLNLSCNHGMPNKGMGRACSDSPTAVQNITKWVVDSIPNIPIFIKLSPNSSINEQNAKAVQRAGGKGVTATNTMYSFMDAQGGKTPYPAVGKNKHTFFGGATGPLIRPIALRVAASIAQMKQNKMQIMATGGVVNAIHAMQYTRFGGASVYQICSAIQQHDFSMINDISTGLKTLLYLQLRQDLQKKGWKGQSPPLNYMQTLKKYKNNFEMWQKNQKPVSVEISKVPKLGDMKKVGLNHIKEITSMSLDQKFPVINDDLCVNCGKCYLTCLDSGYQAIQFQSKDHKPQITADCTGCGLCLAVCPVPGALLYDQRPQKYPYTPQRGQKYFK